MSTRRTLRFIAGILVMLFLSNSVLSAFASPGSWVCPNGKACPFMNGGRAARMPSSAELCRQMSPRPCCICPVGKASTLSAASPLRCRFVASVRASDPDRRVFAESQTERIAAPVLLPASLDDLAALLREARPDFPLPRAASLPPSPLLSSASSRAPPQG